MVGSNVPTNSYLKNLQAESAILALDLCGEMLGSQPIR